MPRESALLSAVRKNPGALALGLGVAGAIAWAFWPTLVPVARQWGSDPRYSHGYLVPLFSLYLLWHRRGTLNLDECRPSAWGLPLLVLGFGLRAVGTQPYLDWVGALALLPCIAGLTMLIGGRGAIRWSWPAIAFLGFMMPLPWRVEVMLAHPLQRIATIASTYVLQTLGFIAIAEGNTIRMGEIRLGVVEACNGLSMLVIFFALATAMAIVIRRPMYERLVIVASAVPVALVANIIRITVTGVLHRTVGSELADYVFHDLAGWLMMPLALILLWIELKILGWVIVDGSTRTRPPARNDAGPRPTAPVPFNLGAPKPVAAKQSQRA